MESTSVGIVVDKAFGPALGNVARKMHLWVRRSDQNQRVVDELRADLVEITSFWADPIRAPEEVVLDVIGDVDLHHGANSQDPPYATLHVFGAHLTPRLRSELASLGFSGFQEGESGFAAKRAGT